MFQPETEDMLPRMAPKPSPDGISGSSETIIRPQVPEVSILFGQQDSHYQQKTYNNPLQQQNKDFPQQTYAAWKKQILPKVNFPANMAGTQQHQENNMKTGYNRVATNINPIQLNNPDMNIGSNVHVFSNMNGNTEMVNQLTYHRSLENCNNKAYQPSQNFTMFPPQSTLGNLQATLSQMPHLRSQQTSTISSGTQTDENIEPTNSVFHIQAECLLNLASKKDVENVRQALDGLRVEQQRILKLLEVILFSQNSQMTTKTHCRDIGVQVVLSEMGNPLYLNRDNDFFENHQPVLKNKFVEHLKPNNNTNQTPKGKPIAQSTTYRQNSPQFQNLKHDSQDGASSPKSMAHKSASDTSLAMNELALKYLPNEKLAELLKELNMDCPINIADKNELATPNRDNLNNFEKGSSDISNASYKYLKKYRLLPEDHGEIRKNNAGEEAILNDIENQKPENNSPQYNMQNPPINQRQTPTNKFSPYAADRLPLSPLARASSPSLQPIVQHIVNLDNIKQQPKFL